MYILGYDTETTGFPDWKAPSDAEQQPHLVQLAACLIDAGTRKIIQSMDVIIKPEGWVIPEDVTEIHGITTEHAMDVGIRESLALEMLLALWSASSRRVGHNESFDAKMIRIATKRYMDEDTQEQWKAGESVCTCRLARDVCQLPPSEKMLAKGQTAFKLPNLTEAYRHFFNRDFHNAHTAMADVQACMDVYFALEDHFGERLW